MFSRLFGKKADDGESENKPWKAQLGGELEMYYNKELKDLDDKAQGTTLHKFWNNLSDEDKKKLRAVWTKTRGNTGELQL